MKAANRAPSALLAFACFAVFFGVFFLPATFGKLMASGDALVESVPAFLGEHRLWESRIFLGYPMYADPNQQLIYPLQWIAAALRAFNVFAVAPFVLAAFGMWGLVRASTQSATAGVVAALIYSLGGFMISHAGHLMIVHPAAWVPFVFWALEAQRQRRNVAALAGGATALGLCAVSGQPEVLAFALAVVICFVAVAGRGALVGRRAFTIAASLTVVLGLGLGAIELVPEAVLAHASTRSTIDFGSFVFLQIPVSQIVTRIVFPYATGVSQLSGFPFSRVDLGAFTEETIGVGLVAIVLATLALASVSRERRILLWFFVAVAGLMLAIGDATPLAQLTYRMPVYGLLRIPGRHAFEWSFAAAILAGYGAAAVERGDVSARRICIALGCCAAIAVAGYAQFVSGSSSSAQFVAQTLAVPLELVRSPLSNGALGFPLATAMIGGVLLLIAQRIRENPTWARLLVISAVLIDMSAFAYPAYWNWGAVQDDALAPTPLALKLKRFTAEDGRRVAWLPGITDSNELSPNLNILWNVWTVDGYTPLIPRRTADLLGTTPGGGVPIPTARDAAMDLAGVSLLAAPAVAQAAVTAQQPFSSDSLKLFFTRHDPEAATHADLGLARPMSATALLMVSDLGESVDVPQDAVIGTLSVGFVNGRVEKHDVVAGRDTAEFAYDRPDVTPQMKHRRATIYSSPGPGHTYVSRFAITTKQPVARIAFDWTYPTAALTIEQLSLVDATTGTAHAFDTLASLYAFAEHWQATSVAASTSAFVNKKVLPHVWLARPIVVTEAQATASVHQGVLADGRAFDPRREAFVEEATPAIPAPLPGDTVRVLTSTPNEVRIASACARECFAVLRDASSNDWPVTVDDRPAKVFVTDVDLRGVAVPAGKHLVRYRFFPIPLMVGIAITLSSALALLGSIVISRRTNGTELRNVTRAER